MKICQTTIFFLCVILFNSCFPIKTVEDSFEINDLSKKQEFSVSIDLQDNQFVYKASLKIKGNSDGEFKINDLFVEPGEIDTLISTMDWYQTEYPIVFQPISSKVGELAIEVTFFIQE